MEVTITNYLQEQYKPAPGQLCETFKGYEPVYPVVDSAQSLENYPLSAGELLLITKTIYNEAISSFYVEFMLAGKIYYCYFHEQVVFFEDDGNGILKKDKPITSFEFPWVECV